MPKLARSVNVTAGQIQHQAGRGYVIEKALGILTLTFDTGDIMTEIVQGDSYFFTDDEYKSVKIDSTVPGEIVTIKLGYFQKFQVGSGTGVIVLDPLNASGQVSIGGPQPFGHQGPLADSNEPVIDGMLYDIGGGQFITVPFRSFDGNALAVQPGPSQIPAFLYTAAPGAGTPLSSLKGYAVLRVQISQVPAAGKLNFIDDYGNVLPIYDGDTGINLAASGGISAANVTGYYVPTSGLNTAWLVGDATANCWITYGTVPFTPTKQ